MNTPAAKSSAPCRRCDGLGSRPCCPKCGRLPELTPAEHAVAVAAFRAMREAHEQTPIPTHEVTGYGGRIVIRRL